MTLFQPIAPVSKRDRIVAALRTAIVRGELEPGAMIAETHVARDFGVGQPLVREALMELEHAGFVQRVPYRGTYVTKFSRQDVDDIFRLRAELEGIAAAWANARAASDDIAALREIVAKMRESALAVDLTEFYEHDLAFHRKIWEIAGNQYLIGALERVVSPLFAFFLMKTPRLRGTYEASASSHGLLVDALEKGPPETVRAMMHDALTRFQGDWDAMLPDK